MKAVRDAIPAETRPEKSLEIQNTVLSLESYKSCSSIFLYYAFGSEVSVEHIAEKALKDKKTVAFPYMTDNKGEMVFIKIHSLSGLVKNKYGIYEPVFNKDNIIAADNKTIVIVPGLAFTPEGFRLGYGGGYYDRYLGRYKTLSNIGVCFSEQIYRDIPINKYDIRLDKLIYV